MPLDLGILRRPAALAGAALGSGSILNVINLAQAIKKQTPTLEDEVTVEVVGQPGANKQKLYYLALSTAFGIVRQYQILNSLLAFVTPSYGMLMSEDDAADNWVRCTVRYQVGMYGALVTTAVKELTGLGGGIGAATSTFDQLTIYRGPQCSTVGGKFTFLSTPIVATGSILPDALLGGIPGIPTNTDGPDAPQLPFAGQQILTPCPMTSPPNPQPTREFAAPTYPLAAPQTEIPSPNPKPPGDNRSRGAIPIRVPFNPNPPDPIGPGPGPIPIGGTCCQGVLGIIPLIFTALSAPATSSGMSFPNPDQGPTGN